MGSLDRPLAMGQAKRPRSPSPLGGPELPFKRFRDHCSSSGMTEASTEYQSACPFYLGEGWSPESPEEEPWLVKRHSIPPNSQRYDNTYMRSTEDCSGRTPNLFTAPSGDPEAPRLSTATTAEIPIAFQPAQLNHVDRIKAADRSRSSVIPGHDPSMVKWRGPQEPEYIDSEVKPCDIKPRSKYSRGSVEIGDVESLREFFMNRFSALLVNPCKPIAARLVEALCPGKKQEFPYLNPSKPELFNGKPPWWPDVIDYRSPHHMRKHSLLSFLSHLLTLPLTNPIELREIFKEGQFTGWSQLLQSTLLDLDLHDGKYLPGHPEKREFDEQRHKARLDVVKEIYRVSGMAAQCAEGGINRDYLVTYPAIPYVCFRERKKIPDSDDQDDLLSTNAQRIVTSESMMAKRNEGAADASALVHSSNNLSHSSGQLQPIDENVPKLEFEEHLEPEVRHATPKTLFYVEAMARGDAFERTERRNPTSWSEAGQEPLLHNASEQIVEPEMPQPRIPLNLTKLEKPDHLNQCQDEHAASSGKPCAWNNKLTPIGGDGGCEQQLPVSQYEPSHSTTMSTCNVDLYMSRNMPSFSSSAPVQGSHYYPSNVGLQTYPEQALGRNERVLQNTYADPRNTQEGLLGPPPTAHPNIWLQPGKTKDYVYQRGRV